MPSQFALPQRINLTQAGTVRAYFLRSILKLVMPTACPLSHSLNPLRRAAIALLLLLAVTVFGQAARAQTLVGTTNKVAFAKATEVAMESQGDARITVVRADGMRGKFTVDVIVAPDFVHSYKHKRSSQDHADPHEPCSNRWSKSNLHSRSRQSVIDGRERL
jgi:hypothetical protein